MQIENVNPAASATVAPPLHDLRPPPAPIDVPQILGGRFRVLSSRGSGAESSVFLAIDLFTGRQVALKLGALPRLEAEYRRCAGLMHPNLAQPLCLWRSGSTAALAFEYGSEDLTALRGGPELLVVRYVAEIARALAYLHQRGIVHGDVKPSNAVLAGNAGDVRALLVDLGFAGEQVARGSLEYAAPEVLEGSPPAATADLYSLGATLHELLSGVNPFGASTPMEMVRARFERAPVPARASAGVQAIVAKLLARDPRSRYANADEVIDALAAATGLPLQAEGEGLGADAIGLGRLYGRERELVLFEERSRLVASGSGQQIVIFGPSGSGRSRLLHAAAITAELAGLRTIRLAAADGLAGLCRRLGVLIGSVAPQTPSVGAAHERLATACLQHPLAVLIDDADRSDDWLTALLRTIARDEVWRRRPLMLVAATERALDVPGERIELGPLGLPDAKAKLLEVFGARTWSAGVADAIVRQCRTTPGDLEDALSDLAARSLIVRQRGRWEFDALRAGAAFEGCVPRRALRRAREVVAALPANEQVELGTAAVLWPDIDTQALVSHEAALVAGGLRIAEQTGLQSSQLAWSRAAEAALSPGERRSAHLRAAEMTRDAAARATHLFRAHASGVLRASLRAARGKLRAGAPLEAARLYGIAQASLRHPLWSPRAAVLCERTADCLALAGYPASARHAYARALRRGGSTARIWQKIAKALWQEGRFDGVLAALERAREAGADALDVAVVEARAEAMRGDYQRAEAIAALALPLARERGDVAAAGKLHHLLGTSAWHRGDGKRAAAEERTAVLIARRCRDARAEADARAGLGTAFRLLSRFGRSATETKRAIDLYRQLGDERQESIGWNNLGVARYLAGDWAGALDAWEVLRERAETLEQELLTLNNLGFLDRERGDLPRSRELLQHALGKIRRAGAYARIEAIVRGNLGETAARAGDVAGAEEHYRQALEIAARVGCRDEIVETGRRRCELDLLRGDPAGASARATETLKLALDSGNAVEQGNLWRVQALAARARNDAAGAAQAVAAAHDVLRRVGAAVEDARADCVECLVEIDRGDLVRASAALRRARAVFERLGAAPDLQEVERLERDVEALQRKSFSHVEALTQAAQRLAGRGEPSELLEDALDEALLLTGAERGFILLTEEGAEPRVAAVRGAVSSGALHISRGVIDRVLHTGEMVAVADIVGNEELNTRKSILDLGLRSVLCAPIRFGGRRLGILYLDSRRVGSMLSEKDLGLLSAFAALAGSALENARLIADLRRKTELLAHMAHEFRSPLQGITGYADLARQDEGMGQRARRGLEVIVTQAKRLAKIVERTLELSRMEAGAVKLRRDRVDPGEVASAAIEGLDPLARMKAMRVTLTRDADVPQVAGDFDRLVQVATNLVGNAIQYSPGGSEITVRIASGEALPARKAPPRVEFEGGAAPAEAACRTAQIVVSDRGPGIPEADLEKLFTPFFRGGPGKGSGLGLVISREIVRQHGGDIFVRSDARVGTTFTVVLPEGS